MPKVLIVEDNEMNRDMLSRRLQRRGFTTTIAVDGGEGLLAVERETPDIIIMDMGLPVVDGWEATRRLKAAPETQKIPVIALTAHAMRGDEERARAAGVDHYLTKPISPKKVVEEVRKILAQ